ncbi:MAPEG family protein [Paraferrimonas haliotis]|uniref:MAPEG family protein n=1 Tax=Paraferrimonas haliotis TaxID=2013866 RepID=UPI000BA96282|nr:MAPEG family protein [Paraferrimonas haliotis]
MSTLIYTLLISCLLPLIAKFPLSYAMQQAGGYNNKYPRAQQASLSGFGARALAGHQNAWEAIIIFAPAVILCIATETVTPSIEYLAITHIACRVAYHIFYLSNHHLLRSLVWTIGFVMPLVMIWQCIPE